MRLKLKDTLVEYLDQLSPKLTRLLARDMKKKRQPLTNLQIANRSGIHPKRVAQISMLDSWASLTVSEIDKFRAACGVTPRNVRWHRAYVKRTLKGKTPMAHLRNRKSKTKFIKALIDAADKKEGKYHGKNDDRTITSL